MLVWVVEICIDEKTSTFHIAHPWHPMGDVMGVGFCLVFVTRGPFANNNGNFFCSPLTRDLWCFCCVRPFASPTGAHLAARFLQPGGLFCLTGARAALGPTPGTAGFRSYLVLLCVRAGLTGSIVV